MAVKKMGEQGHIDAAIKADQLCMCKVYGLMQSFDVCARQRRGNLRDLMLNSLD